MFQPADHRAMSGICGLFALDGSIPSRPEIEAMTAPLERRGPDGTRTWLEGPIALGHALLATTPEAVAECLPMTDATSGCTITADVRLDNREDLISALGLSGETRIIGDGELLLRTYLRWGEDCVAHFLGDFAFAIWDPRAQQLFCARDHMGMRQLVYSHVAARFFAFATEPSSVLAHGEVPRQVNDGRVADYLDNLEGLDLTSTFFQAVCRLPAAHCLTVRRNCLSIRRYWELRPGPELKLGSDEEYAHRFLQVFTEAVRCRLRSNGPVGAMLSGGLDSSSSSAVAASLLAREQRGPLRTFSAVGPDPESCNETGMIQAASANPGISPTFVDHAELASYKDELIQLTRDSAEPFDSNMVLPRAVYLAARDAGVKVVLDGAAGDVILTAGNCVAQLLRLGRIWQAVREAAAEQHFWGPCWPARKTLTKAAWVAFVPRPIRRFRRLLNRRPDHRSVCEGICIEPAFAARSRLEDRRRMFRQHVRVPDGSNRDERLRAITHPHLVVARERYDRVASELAIEPRDPFMDLRVVRFCLSLPSTQLQANGWPKLILRRAMRGMLPPAVIWRRGKDHLGRKFIEEVRRTWIGWREDIGDGIVGIARFAPARPPVRNHSKAKALDIDARFTLFCLVCWLRRGTASKSGT